MISPRNYFDKHHNKTLLGFYPSHLIFIIINILRHEIQRGSKQKMCTFSKTENTRNLDLQDIQSEVEFICKVKKKSNDHMNTDINKCVLT